MNPKNLETVMRSLHAQEDYGRIEKTLNIPVTKETMEFLCKSGLVLDWDFVGELETKEEKPLIPDPTPTNTLPPERILEPSNLQKVEEIIFPTITKKSVGCWEDEKGKLVNLFTQYFPKQLTSENALAFLMAFYTVKHKKPELTMTEETVVKEITPTLPNMEINDGDKVIVAVLEYLDLMLGHQSNKEQCTFFIERIHGVWDKIQGYRNIVEFFEAAFSVKIAY